MPLGKRILDGKEFTNAYFKDLILHCVWNKLYSTKYFGHIRFQKGKLAEDYPYTYEIAKSLIRNSLMATEIPCCLYYYRKVESSISHTNVLQFEDWYSSMDYISDSDSKRMGLVDMIYGRMMRTGDNLVYGIAVNQNIRNLHSDRFCKTLSSVPFSVSKDWGIRHRAYFFVLKYMPVLKNLDIITKIASKNGFMPR